MKLFLSLLSLAGTLTLIHSSANAGVVSGGGGKVVICRNSDNSIKSVELLDLWEARVLYNETTIAVTDVTSGVAAALDALKGAYQAQVDFAGDDQGNDTLQRLRKTADEFLAPSPKVLRLHGETLEPTDDALELLKPNGCEFGQVVNYEPSGRVLVDQDLYDLLDSTNQAALIAHESMYSFLRFAAAEPNSVRTRRAVGYVFSGHRFIFQTPDFSHVHSEDGLYCESGLPGQGFGLGKTILFITNEGGTPKTRARLHAYFTFLNSTAFIGTTPTDWIFPLTNANRELLQIVNGCTPRGGSAELNFSFNGPVEFDRVAAFEAYCGRDGQTFAISFLSPGGSGFEHEMLQCRRYKKN